MNIENSLTYLLTQISIAYRNYLQQAMNEIGLHGGQIFVLISLWDKDGQSQIDLVKTLKLSPPTINKMVGSLARNGFVESQRCGVDGRIMRVNLTDKGRQSKASVESQWEKLESQSFVTLTETEKLILQQILGKLKDNLTKSLALSLSDL